MDSFLIQDMPLVERPRERLARCGVEVMSSEELLALVIRTGYKGKNALAIASDLIRQYPLDQLLRLPLARLQKLKGMGISRASSLLAAVELLRRVHNSEGQGAL